MTSLWQVPAVVLALLVSFASGPATLGNLARREAIRRQLTTPSTASLSNLDLPANPPAAAVNVETGPPVTSEAPPPVTEAAAENAKAKVETKPAEPPRDERWWRDRMAKAKQAVAKNEAGIESTQTKVNGLQSEVMAMDDPIRRETLRQSLLTALAELERLKAQVESDRKAVADIQTDARRAGVPPGWIRD